MERLAISDNGRYFVKPDGTPFVWLADTAWTVPARLKWDDVQHYMKTRREQGFTVLQMVVLDPEYNEEMRNPCGVQALNNGDILDPNEAYFSYVDWVLDQAEAYGFYVLLLPVWGELVVGWDWSGNEHPVYVNQNNAFSYGKWIGGRMCGRNNILWCLGGDRMPVCRGVDYRPVWREMAEGLSEGLTGRRLHFDADREEWKKLLITYHACHEAETGKCSTFSYWTPADEWISFTMLQSGHGLYKKNYELIEAERKPKNMPQAAADTLPETSSDTFPIIYPVWDGEPAYEMMPTCWPVEDLNSFHGTHMVRKRAYWGLLAGAFGHTYGHASVWCTATEKDKDMICRYTWAEAIQSDGSRQMKILRDFMEAYPLAYFEPCQDRLLRQSATEDELDTHEQAALRTAHIAQPDKISSGTTPSGTTPSGTTPPGTTPSGTAEKSQMLIYFAADTEEQIKVGDIFTGSIYGAWFNPKDGTLTRTENLSTAVTDGILPVRNTSSDKEDRVLILTDNPDDITVPSRNYGQSSEDKTARKVFEW